ncbi:hypothetical protein KUTeg_015550 [Tegillarca granosa]|uniref:Enhancer of polycomb-like protein n=1 Tax=Tegillarca granosa TaxID=220873 RepID=A0ABQ9EU36_TEGGR|nr:hypothetical protein KUTeg_015550 [Tegillarca granosa]
MSKVSFRARALDATKPMAVYKADEIPDLPDFANINRSVPQMPTGMEKEEETEHHLQRALSAQQVYGTSERLEIPIPEVDEICDRYDILYNSDFKQTKQFIHIQAVGIDQEIPDYDMDSEDEQWLDEQVKKMEITPIKFEEMMDRLEKGSGQQVVTLPEAKLLLKEDDDLTIAVYDYWLNKRLRLNRKNDETSYEKMLKLRRDLSRAVTLLEMIKRREKAKKEMLQLTIEVVDKRYHLEDYEGKLLEEAEAIRHKLPSFIPPMLYSRADWGHGEESSVVRKKREYRKRKHKQTVQQQQSQTVTVPTNMYSDIDVLHTEGYSSEDEGLSPGMSPSDHEDENDPDGQFAFRRRKNCNYYAPQLNRLGNWSWNGSDDGGTGDKKFRYNLLSLSQPHRCLGFARRRIGRGGRQVPISLCLLKCWVLIDRASTPWDEELSHIDLSSNRGTYSGVIGDYITYIRDRKIPHYRSHSPTTNDTPSLSNSSKSNSAQEDTEFNFQSHREQLIQMQRAQQEKLLQQDSLADLDSSCTSLDHSFSSQPTSRFTLDSASAKFAVSAVMNTSQIQSVKTGVVTSVSTSLPASSLLSSLSSSSPFTAKHLPPPLSTSSTTSLLQTAVATSKLAAQSLTNGPTTDCKTTGLSTSPAATVLQLNFPINNSNSSQHIRPTLQSSTSAASSLTSALMSSTSAFSPINSTISSKSNTNLIKLSAANFNSGALDGITKQNCDDVNRINNIHIKRDKVAMDVT